MITGVVTGKEGKQPVAQAAVTVTGNWISGLPLRRAVFTDGDGRFTLSRMPAGRFTVSVQASGFLPATYGQKRVGGNGTAVLLASGQRAEIAMSLLLAGSISGTVTTDTGAALPNVWVNVLQRTVSAGFPRLVRKGTAETNERGMYRIAGLPPGDYIVAVTPTSSAALLADREIAREAAIMSAAQTVSGSRLDTVVTLQPVGTPNSYVPMYFPGTEGIATASIVSLTAEEDRSAVDIHVRFVTGATIKGRVVGPDGGPVLARVVLESRTVTNPLWNPTAMTDGDGVFALVGVTPGQYTMSAQSQVRVPQEPRPGPQFRNDDTNPLSAHMELEVVDQPADVLLALRRSPAISGRITSQDSARRAAPPVVVLERAPDAGQPIARLLRATVQPDGTFAFPGVAPGAYFVRLDGGRFATSVLLQGRDITELPLQVEGTDVPGIVITEAERPAELNGHLSDALGAATPEYTLVIAPADPRHWVPGSRRVATARPGSDGRYVFRGLPAGEYALGAVTDFEPGTEFDPEFLRELTGTAVRVSMPPEGIVTRDVRLGR